MTLHLPIDSEWAGTLHFLHEAGRLKDTLRSAHTRQGRVESTAEHSWRLCLWVMALGDALGDIDVQRLLELLIVHDLGEALQGDTPATEQHNDPHKSEREHDDLLSLTATLPATIAARLMARWQEYEAAQSPEATLAKALDKLETLLTHAEGNNPDGFDYGFNLEYGRHYTDALPLTRALRVSLDEATRQRG